MEGLEAGERERELERQRGIDRVIDQQAFNQVSRSMGNRITMSYIGFLM